MILSLHNPRNGPAFDLSPGERPTRTWVLASTPRTGSTLVCRLAWATGFVGAPMEYLNPRDMRDWIARCDPAWWRRWGHWALGGPLGRLGGMGITREEDLEGYLQRLRERRTGPTGWFGIKLHAHQYRRWFLHRGWSAPRILKPSRWVFIRRRDRVAQAVSWALALQTNRWTSGDRSALPAVYSRRLIEELLRRIERDEGCWETTFAAHGVEPLRIDYETLRDDPVGATRALLEHLDCDPNATLDLVDGSRLELERQWSAINQDWCQRFHRRSAS